MSSSVANEAASDRVFERLYRRHRRDVYRFVLRDVRDPDDAEDVTQATFLNAFRALRRGDEPEKPRAWLLTIAQNVARRRFRTQASRPREVELDPDTAAAPELEGFSASEIREALECLRPNQRAALVLREIGGHSYAEVADRLGLSVSAVETLIFRARRALREELEGVEAVSEPRWKRTVGALGVAVPELLARTLAWLRRGMGAKMAGAAGAAAIATGVAVQSGAIAVPNGAGEAPPVLKEEPATPASASSRNAPAAPKQPAAEAKAAEKRRAEAAGGAGQPEQASDGGPAQLPLDVSKVVVELPSGTVQITVPELNVPEISVPEVTVPPVPEVTVPPVPEVTVPPVPDVQAPLPEAPTLPETDKVLP